MKATVPPSPPAHPARLILILSLAPTVGLGIGRFAYSLVLPDMRDSLRLVVFRRGLHEHHQCRRLSRGRADGLQTHQALWAVSSVRWGTVACVVSLVLCALSGNFVVLSFARLLAGVGAAVGFVAGAALAAPDRPIAAEAGGLPAQLVLCRAWAWHPFLRPDRAVRIAGVRTGFVVDRVVGNDAARRCDDCSVDAGADRHGWRFGGQGTGELRHPASIDLSRRLFSVRRWLHRVHDIHDRLRSRCRRRRDGAKRVLEPDRRQRVSDPLVMGTRARPGPGRPLDRNHSRGQCIGGRRCRYSGIPLCCSRFRRWCSEFHFSRWWHRPPPLYASTIRLPPGQKVSPP